MLKFWWSNSGPISAIYQPRNCETFLCRVWKGETPKHCPTQQPLMSHQEILHIYTFYTFWMCLNNWNIGGEGFPYQRWSKVGVTTKNPNRPCQCVPSATPSQDPILDRHNIASNWRMVDLTSSQGVVDKISNYGFSIWMINELGRVHHLPTMNSFYYQLHFFTLYTLWDYLESTNEIDHWWRENKN